MFLPNRVKVSLLKIHCYEVRGPLVLRATSMNSDSSIRRILWIAAAFNLGGAFLFAFPDSSLGRSVGLPVPVPGIYCAILAFLIAFFGVTYVWLARRASVDRPLVGFFALGKGGVFGVVLIFWILGAAPGKGVIAATGDLIFALLFARWLWTTRDIQGRL